MAKYLVNAPDRASVTISCNYGTLNYKHHDVIENDAIAKMFPNIFLLIKEEVKKAVEPTPVVIEPTPVVEEAPVVVEPTPVVEEAPVEVTEQSYAEEVVSSEDVENVDEVPVNKFNNKKKK